MNEGEAQPATLSGEPAHDQSFRFLILYALAVAGGAMAYVPFLTILLPVRVEALADGEEIRWLAAAAFTGAIAASLANIAFGWLSDRTRTRRPWIAAGLVLSCSLLVSMSQVSTLKGLIGLLVAWQISLNMMLGPLAAMGGDHVPDHQKGTLGGLLAFAPALGAISGMVVTIPGLAGPDARLSLVAFLVSCCVLPVLLLGKPRPFPQLMISASSERPPEHDVGQRKGVVVRMWLARLLVQVAEAALFAYLYLWFRTISQDFSDNQTAQVFGFVLMASVPLTLLVGRWADRNDRPIMPLAACAGITALALLAMAGAGSLTIAMAGYVLFGLASAMFLALHSAQTLRVLPRPERRGRDLGLFNLTNTLPSLVMPGLTLALVPAFGFSGLFILLSALVALAALLLASVMRKN